MCIQPDHVLFPFYGFYYRPPSYQKKDGPFWPQGAKLMLFITLSRSPYEVIYCHGLIESLAAGLLNALKLLIYRIRKNIGGSNIWRTVENM